MSPTTDTLGTLQIIRNSKLSQHTKRELMGTLLLDAHTLLIELGLGNNAQRKHLLRLMNARTLSTLVNYKTLEAVFSWHYPTLARICKQKDPVTGRLKMRKMRKIDMAFLIALDISEGYTAEQEPRLLNSPPKTKNWYSRTVAHIENRS